MQRISYLFITDNSLQICKASRVFPVPAGPEITKILLLSRLALAFLTTSSRNRNLVFSVEDLQKCFDSSKTGISSDDIVEIVYCHTYTRLLAGEDKQLRDFCETRNSKLVQTFRFHHDAAQTLPV